MLNIIKRFLNSDPAALIICQSLVGLSIGIASLFYDIHVVVQGSILTRWNPEAHQYVGMLFIGFASMKLWALYVDSIFIGRVISFMGVVLWLWLSWLFILTEVFDLMLFIGVPMAIGNVAIYLLLGRHNDRKRFDSIIS